MIAERLGEHTLEILGEAGYDAGQIARLRDDGVVVAADAQTEA